MRHAAFVGLVVAALACCGVRSSHSEEATGHLSQSDERLALALKLLGNPGTATVSASTAAAAWDTGDILEREFKDKSMADCWIPVLHHLAGQYPPEANLQVTASASAEPTFEKLKASLGEADSTEEGKVAGVPGAVVWHKYGWCHFAVSEGKVVRVRGDCRKLAASAKGASPKPAALIIRQSPADPDCLVGSLPANPNASDALVLVYVPSGIQEDASQAMLVPAGRVGKTVENVLKLGERAGFEIHQINALNNGSFEFVYARNSQRNWGVYAAANVKTEGEYVASSTTYFDLRRWAAKDKGAFEIPLPEPGPGVDGEYLPRSCTLHVWLMDKAGQIHGYSTADIKRP